MGNRYGEQILYNPVKPIGLYQTSDVPGTVKFRGYNAYRVVVMLLMLYLSIMATLIGATCVYYWNTARMTSIVSLTMSLSYFHVCYKAWFVVYHHSADVIWECLSVARFNYNGSGLQDGRKRLARAWRNRTVRALYAYGIIVLTALSVYVTCPLVFDDTTVVVVRRDGSTGNYRQTVYNLHLFGETVYNAYFGWVYCAEVSCSMIYLLFSGMFDTTLITVSATLLCQLQAVGTAFELVGQKTIPDVRHQTDRTDNENKSVDDEYNDLTTIIVDHQMVMQKLNAFIAYFRSAVLIQIVISSVDIIFNWFIIASCLIHKDIADSKTLTLRMLSTIPMFFFQLLLPCYVFGRIHDQKDSIIFSLYTSNWMDMDLKCKQLILMTMKMNNAYQQKLKLSSIYIVNLEMFFRTVRVCYTMFSMLLNYK